MAIKTNQFSGGIELFTGLSYTLIVAVFTIMVVSSGRANDSIIGSVVGAAFFAVTVLGLDVREMSRIGGGLDVPEWVYINLAVLLFVLGVITVGSYDFFELNVIDGFQRFTLGMGLFLGIPVARSVLAFNRYRAFA